MKTYMLIFSIFFLFGKIYSQQNEINSDSLIVGDKYKIVLDNRWETEGSLINVMDETLLIETKGNYKIIQRNIIKSMTMAETKKDVIQSKENNKTCTIYLNNGNIIKKVKFEDVKSDTLYALRHQENLKIPLFEIDKIIIPSKSKSSTTDIVIGSSVGAVLGGVLGGVLGYTEAPKDPFINTKSIGAGIGALAGVIVGGIIGAVVAANIDADDEYDFTSMDKETKEIEIRKIIEDSK